MSNSIYMPNFGSLSHPHGLEEAHVVHRPDPGGRIQKIPSRGRSLPCPLSSHQVLSLIGPAISESISLKAPHYSLLPQGSLRSPWDYSPIVCYMGRLYLAKPYSAKSESAVQESAKPYSAKPYSAKPESAKPISGIC